MATPPEWLKMVALEVDELLQVGTRVVTRFQQMIVEYVEAEKRTSKDGSMGGKRLVHWLQHEGRSRGTGSGVLRVKALPLSEKYTWLAAIHDTIGEGVTPISPYRSRQLERALFGVYMVLARDLTDADQARIERMLDDVRRDLHVVADGPDGQTDEHWMDANTLIEKAYVLSMSQVTKIAQRDPEIRRDATSADRKRLGKARIQYVYDVRKFYELSGEAS